MLCHSTLARPISLLTSLPLRFSNDSLQWQKSSSCMIVELDCCCVTILQFAPLSFDKSPHPIISCNTMLLGDNNTTMSDKRNTDMPLEGTRGRLLQVGARLFAKHGFKGISLNRIAREAKTSSSSILHFFESKEGLLKTICEQIWKEINDWIVRAFEEREPAPAKCEKILTALVDYFDSHQNEERLILLESKHLDEQQKGPITWEEARFKETFDIILQEGKRNGFFSRDSCIPAAREGLLGLVEGMLFTRLLDRRFGYSHAKYGRKEIQDMLRSGIMGLSIKVRKTRTKKSSKKKR